MLWGTFNLNYELYLIKYIFFENLNTLYLYNKRVLRIGLYCKLLFLWCVIFVIEVPIVAKRRHGGGHHRPSWILVGEGKRSKSKKEKYSLLLIVIKKCFISFWKLISRRPWKFGEYKLGPPCTYITICDFPCIFSKMMFDLLNTRTFCQEYNRKTRDKNVFHL